MSELWRGTWATRLRVASGLVLMIYAAAHFLNIGLGVISGEAMQLGQDLRLWVTRSVPGSIILYGALGVHTALALAKLMVRRTLKMPLKEGAQYIMGFAIPLLLLTHITYTRASHELFEVNDTMAYIIGLIWNTRDGWLQAGLLIVVWAHGCLGMHHWLSAKAWYRASTHYALALALVVPIFALAGFMSEGRRLRVALADPDAAADHFALTNFPTGDTWGALAWLDSTALYTFLGVVFAAVAIHVLRRVAAAQSSVLIVYEDGPQISAQRGMTLLEMSRSAGVPHTSLCGGRGRCTTCRVAVLAGGQTLDDPDAAEQRSLDAVDAPPGQRLACQICPTAPLTVARVFLQNAGKARAHASQGTERDLAILFLDMRSFTARTAGQLPYDVVFLLNRFFDAIVPAITKAGGTVDKYLGDGLLAVFETVDAGSSARAGLRAAQAIGEALAEFNQELAREGAPPVKIGIGLHLGNVVLGEIGAQGNAPRTLIGDSVNTASRLEGQTKGMGVELLVSGALLEAAGVAVGDGELEVLELRRRCRPVACIGGAPRD